jgi:protein O-mannosyl-transferase
MAVTSAVYLRCLSNGFVLDDVPMIVRNPDLRNWSFLWKAFTREEFWYSDAAFLPHYRNYRPLLLVWYWMDNRLFGLNPAPWHASILIVHLLAVWLVFKISRRLTGDPTSALVAASLFALTPVHVAAVVWMAGAGFVFATAFGLAAFYLIMPRTRPSIGSWAGAILLYACALLSHESAIAFPVLVACYAFLFYEDNPGTADAFAANRVSLLMRTRRAGIWSAPFFVELLLYLVARKLVLGFFVNNPYDYANLLTGAQTILSVPWVLATYLTMLAMPWLTLPAHRVFPVSSASSPEFWAPLAGIMLIAVASFLLAFRSSRSRFYLFCAAWIGVTLAPMLLLHSVYHLVQDYYLYLPSVGWSLLLGDLIAVVAQQNAFARRLALGCAAAILMVYAIALWRVQRYWHDDIAAARGFIQGFPESTAWHLTLAIYLEQSGDLATAEQEVRTTIRLEPDKTGTIHPDPKALDQILGDFMAKRGDIEDAEAQFRKSASEQYEDDPHSSPAQGSFVESIFDLYAKGLRDQASGLTTQATKEISEAVAMMSSYPSPAFGPLALRYVPLAQLYDAQGDHEQVQSILKKMDSMPEGELAVALARAEILLQHDDKRGAEQILLELADRYPMNPEVLIKLGNLQTNLNQNEQALNSYQRISHWTGHPHLYVAIAKSFHALGHDREALDQCRLALALAPAHDLETRFACTEIRNSVENK